MQELELPFFNHPICLHTPLREKITQSYRMDETAAIQELLDYISVSADAEKEVTQLAEKLVRSVRQHQAERSFIESFMLQYDLSMEEGILMMCLAEALLRIPDKETERLLLKDKLSSASWDKHIGASESTMVDMATWGLAFSGKILSQPKSTNYFKTIWNKLVLRSSEPMIRKAVREAMRILSKQFIIGQNIEDAIKQSAKLMQQGYRFSFDMLGEVARTQKDANRYYQAYRHAIEALGHVGRQSDLIAGPSISVKLSALFPRYEYKEYQTAVPYLIERVKDLVLHAKNNNISVTIDAEEADRLDMSLDIIEALFADPDLAHWEGLGLALQAYQKRAFYVIDWLIDLARQHKKRIQVRLVKGAYWDSEVKLSQVEGLTNYPVFTRKNNTDVSYLACAKKLLSARAEIYPQFATHNAYSVAAILTMLGDQADRYELEFQSLQGMGRALHNEIVDKQHFNLPCRIYAPVGSHQDLLPYLVRRLLENGANSSFVNKIADENFPIEKLIESPLQKIKNYASIANPKIPLPRHIYGDGRLNSSGLDLSDQTVLVNLNVQIQAAQSKGWGAAPFLRQPSHAKAVYNPADLRQEIGWVEEANEEDVEEAVHQAVGAFTKWSQRGVDARATILRKAADLYEEHYAELMYLAIREAGKTLHDAIAEVREAVDFCRYYAEQAEKQLVDQELPGPTGESNVLSFQGRGVILCISPWNFPLAIFTGQIAAALVAGNTVIAKPAEQTPLISALAVKLFIDAGCPADVLQFLPGQGETIGKALVEHPKIAGVMFTGSNETAALIYRSLAARPGPILPFIAETGGINAMIADSTALSEQLVRDAMASAFGSAGQRCSALRVLFVQEDIADGVIAMLKGAMAELSVGDPMLLATDIGPVIDGAAKRMLNAHSLEMQQQAELIYQVELDEDTCRGTFIAPQAYELAELSLLKKEVFGPILHVIRYRLHDLDKVIDQVNALGYGLTFGIQSRIDETIDHIVSRIQAGNIYVNRTMIGAVVGVQPFGGSRLSGTGPKAGGPHYLLRLCQESTLTVNTTAVGGNASLMAMED